MKKMRRKKAILKKRKRLNVKSGRPRADVVSPEVKRPAVEAAASVESKSQGSEENARKEQDNIGNEKSQFQERDAESCPYCESKDFVKRGLRENKHQQVQLYVCRNTKCSRTFTSRTIKGKQFPWPVVLDAVSYHNLGYTFEQTSKILEHKFFGGVGKEGHAAKAPATSASGLTGRETREQEELLNVRAISAAPQPDTIAKWYEEYKPLCRFERMRPYALKILAAWRGREAQRQAQLQSRQRGKSSTAGNIGTAAIKFDMVETTTLAHRQLYRFRYHRPKLVLALEEYKNRGFGRLMEFLDAVSTETPHQFFSDGERMSEVRSKFDKTDMIVKSKENFANQLTKFVLQGVPENKERHEVLQRFLIANDSVTVATEVPVYIRREDIEHMERVLKFQIVGDEGVVIKGKKGKGSTRGSTSAPGLPKILTGHIDIVQVRNGIVHLLDYKPGAAKEKPIEQLTWYALALSRLTGLRLFEFKCAWFDEHDYFEFYPLHVVKKVGRARTKKIRYKDGSVGAIPRENTLTIV